MAQPILVDELFSSFILVAKPKPSPILVVKPNQIHVPILMLPSINQFIVNRKNSVSSVPLSCFDACILNYVHASEASCVQFWQSTHTVSPKNDVRTQWKCTPKLSLKYIYIYEILVSHTKLCIIAHVFLVKIACSDFLTKIFLASNQNF